MTYTTKPENRTNIRFFFDSIRKEIWVLSNQGAAERRMTFIYMSEKKKWKWNRNLPIIGDAQVVNFEQLEN